MTLYLLCVAKFRPKISFRMWVCLGLHAGKGSKTSLPTRVESKIISIS